MADAELVRSCCQEELETEDIEPEPIVPGSTPPRKETTRQADRSAPDALDVTGRINK
jgi:hypothetical protein